MAQILWLWHRLAATAPIRPLAWEPPYATGAALEKTKRQKKKESYCGLWVLMRGQCMLIDCDESPTLVWTVDNREAVLMLVVNQRECMGSSVLSP